MIIARPMYEVLMSCASCDEQLEVIVAELDEVELLGCECGAVTTIESISAFEAWRSPPRLRAIDAVRAAADEELRRAA